MQTLGRLTPAASAGTPQQPPPAGGPLGLCPLVGFRQQHGQDAGGANHHQDANDHRGHGHVLLGILVQHPDHHGAGAEGHQGEEAAAEVGQLPAANGKGAEHEHGEDHGHAGQHPPFRHPDDIGREGKLGFPVDVVDAPVGTHRALALGLPGLVEGFHEVVDVALLRCPGQEAAQEHRFIGVRRHGGFPGAPVAGPAHLGEDDRLAGEGLFQQGDLVVDVADGGLGGDALPVGQHVHGEVVHVVSEFRVADPDVPGLGCAHGLA